MISRPDYLGAEAIELAWREGLRPAAPDPQPLVFAGEAARALDEAVLAAFPLPEGVADAVLNRSQVAVALQVSDNTITKFVQQGMPYLAEGSNGREWQFRLAECYAWRRHRDSETARERRMADEAARQVSMEFRNLDEDEPGGWRSAREIREESEAEIVRLRAEEARRNLVRADRMAQLLEDLLVAFCTGTEALVDFCEMEFAFTPAEAEKLKRRTDGMILELRDRVEAELVMPKGAVAPIAGFRSSRGT